MKKVSLIALMLIAETNVNAANFYVGGKLGYAYQGTTNYNYDKKNTGRYKTQFNNTIGLRGEAFYGNAFDYSVAVGVKTNDVRFDLEASNTSFGEEDFWDTEDDGADPTADPAFKVKNSSLKLGNYSTSFTSFMLNTYYDIDLQKLAGINSPVKPYVQAGIGFLILDRQQRTGVSKYQYERTEKLKGWSIGSGLSYEVMPMLSLDLGYKYQRSFANKEKEAENNAKEINYEKFTKHSVLVGARYSF